MEEIKIEQSLDIITADLSSAVDNTASAVDSASKYSKIPPYIKNKWYKYIIQNATEGFFITDMKSRILDVNDAFCHMSGYSREELLTMGLYDLDTRLIGIPDGKEQMEKMLRWTKEHKQKPGSFVEVQHRRKDGRIIDISVSIKYMDVLGG
jgi:PAS domain S-box-containing protein